MPKCQGSTERAWDNLDRMLTLSCTLVRGNQCIFEPLYKHVTPIDVAMNGNFHAWSERAKLAT